MAAEVIQTRALVEDLHSNPSSLNDPKTEIIMCPFCKLCSKDLNELKKHFENIHSDSKSSNEQDLIQVRGSEMCNKCELCTFIGNETEIQRHMKTKHTQPVECDECGNEFPDRSTLDGHIKAKHGAASNEPFVCEWCEQVFINFNLLQSHVHTHHGTEPASVTQDVTCPFCKSHLNGLEDLKTHVETIHTSKTVTEKNEDTSPTAKTVEWKKCVQCEKRFADGKKLTAHIKDKQKCVHLLKLFHVMNAV